MVEVFDIVPDELKDVEMYVFKVYLSPRDNSSVFGYLTGPALISQADCKATWLTTPYGVAVEEAYIKAIEVVESAGLLYLKIDDPDGLFPAGSRPAIGS